MQLVNFSEYEVLELNNNKKIEKWNKYILERPETSAIWYNNKSSPYQIDAVYNRSKTGGGEWIVKNPKLNKPWQIKYKDLTFNLKLMGFKHTGLFPEQAYNWDYLRDLIKKENYQLKVLNLFAYTGGATLAALAEGAEVVHVDSSKGMVDWAKENVNASNLQDKKVHFIVEDVLKFVKRELRRGNKYDIIIMDPPTFGRGAKNELWNIEKNLFELLTVCAKLLSNKPLMLLINSYSNGIDIITLENLLKETIKLDGTITSDSLGFKVQNSSLLMPCGIFCRWESK